MLTHSFQSKQASIDFDHDAKAGLYSNNITQNSWQENHVQNSGQLLKQSGPEQIERTEGIEMRYDSTGMFHWCSPRRIAEAELTKEQCTKLSLQVSHIQSSTTHHFPISSRTNIFPRVVSGQQLILEGMKFEFNFSIGSMSYSYYGSYYDL